MSSAWRRVHAAPAVYTTLRKQRTTRQARAMCQLQEALLTGQDDAIAVVVALSQDQGAARRIVERALGKWRGSTVSGYLRGDDRTYLENFRCGSQHRFNDLVERLAGSALDRAETRTGQQLRRGASKMQKANAVKDPPTLRYKVAVCMYALGQGGPIKVIADAVSLGKSTVRKYLGIFADSVVSCMKGTFMPGKPFSAQERAAVQGQFASRHGMRHVGLACDGSHIPFKPKSKKVAGEYRNYKGWTSILTVAFVDSYYRFFEVHVGYPGRAGDNTVLARMKFMAKLTQDPETWLGPGGVVLGDSGASDGDRVFLNPYFNPTDPDKCHFNFCHSSTRFFVEQVFGIWKSRFRFLLSPMMGANHKLVTKLIYTSTILHNYLVAHRGDAVEIDTTAPCWSTFFHTFEAQMCPECKANRLPHCTHQAAFRNGPGVHARVCMRPSEMRDAVCERLWSEVCDGQRARMEVRARTAAVGGVVFACN